MKKIVLWWMSTLTALVLLFGYHTSTSSRAAGGDTVAIAPIVGGTGSTTAAATSGDGEAAPVGEAPQITVGQTSAATTSAEQQSTTGATTAAGSAGKRSVTGAVADTRWGPVQVELTIEGSKITNVSVVQYPDGNGRDAQINSYALPILISETISNQSARIDMVSGATVTSQGYVTSLQSALDQAQL